MQSVLNTVKQSVLGMELALCASLSSTSIVSSSSLSSTGENVDESKRVKK